MVLLSLQLTLIRQRGEGVAFDVGQQKKPKATKDQVLWPGAKKHPHNNNNVKIVRFQSLCDLILR